MNLAQEVLVALEEDINGIYQCLLSFDVPKDVADTYADLILKDSTAFTGGGLRDHIKSRLTNILDDEFVGKALSMIMDEL